MVQQVSLGRINPSNADHIEAARLATCAQVEYWFGLDESISTNGGYDSLSIGSFSINFGSGGDQRYRQFSPRSRGYLNHVGLLYRGVKISANT